jgi:hypothetical protein
MNKQRSANGRRRRRGGVYWELYWEYGEHKFLVQEEEYSEVIKRLSRLSPVGLTRLGYRQLHR